MAATACSGPTTGQSAPAKDNLKIGVAVIPTTLDPGQNFERQQVSIMKLASGTLTDFDRDGKQVTMGLAESVEASGPKYVVKLKPNLKFSDGSALTAQDVVATFEHYLADDTNGYAYSFTSIEKVTAVDDLTVDFDLKEPNTALPYYFAQPQSAIIPSEAIESKGAKDLYKGAPLPTAGQFEIATVDQNQIALKANTQYAGSQPTVKSLVFQKIADTPARLAQVQGGQIDYADEIGPKQSGQLTAPLETRSVRAISGVNFVTLNTRENSVLSDVRIRRAVGVAIDREQVNQVAFAGQSAPTLGLFASSSQYSKPFLPKTPDVGRAKELLAGTACADGCKLRLIVSTANDVLLDAAVVLQQNLKAVGIDVTLEKAEAATISKRRSEGNFDLSISVAYDVADYPDGFLAWSLGPTYDAFRSHYSNPELTKLLATTSATTGSDRSAAVEQINALFEKDLPLVPLTDMALVSASRVPSTLFDINPTTFYHVG